VILTYPIDQIPLHRREAFKAAGSCADGTVTIDTSTPAGAALFQKPLATIPKEKRHQVCPRCGGSHKLKDCPIPPDTSPETERRKARQGGCCGEPSAA
jgi:hypothetical protein